MDRPTSLEMKIYYEIAGLTCFYEKSLFLTLSPFSRSHIFSVIGKRVASHKPLQTNNYYTTQGYGNVKVYGRMVLLQRHINIMLMF